jgi:hypothetical protein
MPEDLGVRKTPSATARRSRSQGEHQCLLGVWLSSQSIFVTGRSFTEPVITLRFVRSHPLFWVTMPRFLRDFDFDRVSFWLGFIAGTLLWWLLSVLRPLATRMLQSLRESSQISKLGATAVTEIRLRNDILRHAQGLHLAAPLFSLDEIAVLPRLLASPVLTEPGVVLPSSDIVEQVLLIFRMRLSWGLFITLQP